MALDATVGGATSNSYVTREEANAYFGDRLHATAWTELGNTEKDQALITATHTLDWYCRWKGIKASDTQALDHPRDEVTNPTTGEYYPTNALIPAVKVATFELALVFLERDRTADPDLAGLKEVRAASLMLKTDDKDFNSDAPKTIPDKIFKILDGLLVQAGFGVVRLMRA